MAATYTKTVNFTNSNPNGGEDYTWQNLNSNATWVTKSAGANANEWNFTIQDNTAQNATTRSTTWKVTHWSYSTDDDLNTWDAFTITQYADGSTTVATTEFKNITAATTEATQATAATTEATQATAATTEATLGTAATTEATLGTAATTQPTNATAATTQPTNATAATTQATAATTQPTPATTTQAKTIAFTSGNKTVTSGGQSFLLSAQVNTAAVTGKNTSMPTITYKSSGGGGAGQMYWASDASGSTPISAPSWITSGSGGTFNSSGVVNMSVSIDPYN
jgi:hypothetical protein